MCCRYRNEHAYQLVMSLWQYQAVSQEMMVSLCNVQPDLSPTRDEEEPEMISHNAHRQTK